MKRIISVFFLIIFIALPSLSLADTPKAPEIVRINAITPYEVYLTWNKVKGVKGYQIRYGKGNKIQNLVKTKELEYYINGLSVNSKYYFQVRAYYKQGSKTKYTEWSKKKYVTPKVPPTPKITSLSFRNNAVLVKWNKCNRAESYEIQYKDVNATEWTIVDDPQGYRYEISSGLVSGGRMAFRIRSEWWTVGKNKVKKWTKWSSVKYIDIPELPEGTPIPTVPKLALNSLGDATVEIQWTVNNCASGYEFQWDRKNVDTWSYSTGGDNLGYCFAEEGLVVGDTYKFRGRAVYYDENDNEKTTAWSDPVYAKIWYDGDKITYKVIYSGGLYLNEKPAKSNCTIALMKKGEKFVVKNDTQMIAGSKKYVWAEAEYKGKTGWVCVGNLDWCVMCN